MTHSPERILITGGAAGIGHAIAIEAEARGHDVIVIDRDKSTVGKSIVANLSDVESTRKALEAALAGGPVTRLVNNVGAVFPNRLEDQTIEEVNAAFALNLRPAVQCTQAVVPGMRKQGFGRIVNMASRAALGKELRTAYAASKAGLLGLTRVWALELGRDGITVNAIGPGPIATELFRKANPPKARATQAIIDAIPVRRMGTPEDISHAAWFFLDERSGFVTGQTLYACGGMSIGTVSL
ncbi:SDR family NAD(P)-dependent oxidoreductase [Cryobacterium sp. Y11]|uniref:SDR family NAD(P)-dependent oxidoreductase n=1 Tax=Cryobacterium sp. Y11 TaxID=2045016 RepID=UPI000CE53C09|nr:SDR family oxidoreductase [Cryobacterium sp. Y11]